MVRPTASSIALQYYLEIGLISFKSFVELLFNNRVSIVELIGHIPIRLRSHYEGMI